MTKEKYEKLKAKIVEANPEIMELKFGCRMKKDNGEEYIFAGDINILISKKHCHLGYNPHDLETEDIGSIINDKILGRPITLADVLLAIKKKEGSANFGEVISVMNFVPVVDNWNLLLPLSCQSDETKELIAKILGYEE